MGVEIKNFSFSVAFSWVPVLSHFLPLCWGWCKNFILSNPKSSLLASPWSRGWFCTKSELKKRPMKGWSCPPVVINSHKSLTWCMDSLEHDKLEVEQEFELNWDLQTVSESPELIFNKKQQQSTKTNQPTKQTNKLFKNRKWFKQ